MTASSTLPGKREVDAVIEKAVHLHTLPVIIFEANRLMRDPRTSAQQVADLIARDPVIAARMLRLVNSSYYGFQQRIGNLTQAIVILGFQTVKNIMLTVTVIESFRRDRHDPLDYPLFWSHSVACAIAAGEIARLAKTPHADEAYVAGLLHDIGKLLIAQHLPSIALAVRDKLEAGMSEVEAERLFLGRDHSDVGCLLARSWLLPESLTEAIRDHHHPQPMKQGSSADVVHLADLLVSAFGITRPDSSLPRAAEGLSCRLGYNEVDLAEWIRTIVTALEQAEDFFEVVGAGPLQLD